MRGLLLSCILVVALAQHVNAQIAPHHHWIGFESKVGCGVDLADPNAGLALLSQRALDRRDKQGISLDSTDLPIPPHLVDDVLSLGISDAGQAIKMLHRSRWFNGIVIQIDTALVDSAQAATMLAQIQNLSGVIEVRRARWFQNRGALPVAHGPRSSVISEAALHLMVWPGTKPASCGSTCSMDSVTGVRA